MKETRSLPAPSKRYNGKHPRITLAAWAGAVAMTTAIGLAVHVGFGMDVFRTVIT